jgi:Polyketide cyclase / dehydrase and lipid transport
MARRAAFDVRTRSAATPGVVFDLVSDATTWSAWAGRSVTRSSWERPGDDDPFGVGAVRRVGSRLVSSREQIIEYDRPHYLAYTVLSWVPMRDYRAIVSVDREHGGTRITWAGAFEPLVPGTGRLLTWMLTRLIGGMASGLARYAETRTDGVGDASPPAADPA